MDYVYDLVGKISQVTDPTGTYGFAYDNMGRLIGTTTQYTFLPATTFSNTYTYDAASNRKTLTAPDGSTNTYNYDTLNRLSSLTTLNVFCFERFPIRKTAEIGKFRPSCYEGCYELLLKQFGTCSRQVRMWSRSGCSHQGQNSPCYDPLPFNRQRPFLSCKTSV